MIDEILDAVGQEALAFMQSVSDPSMGTGTVIVETDFKADDLHGYGMPLLIIDMVDGQETSQYPGGATRVDWMFGFNSYNYMPDANIDDSSKYSTGLLKIIDMIRVHFSIGNWLTAGMTQIFNDYCFDFTLMGVTRAKTLNADGLVMGWRLGFDSIAVDPSTNFTVPSEQPLEEVEQVFNLLDQEGDIITTEDGQNLLL